MFPFRVFCFQFSWIYLLLGLTGISLSVSESFSSKVWSKRVFILYFYILGFSSVKHLGGGEGRGGEKEKEEGRKEGVRKRKGG